MKTGVIMKKKYIPHAEIPVVEHCNLNCKLCNSHAYLVHNSTYPFEQFKKDVDVLSAHVHFGLITFMGGEPLLCTNLEEYIRYARAHKLAGVYRILTNGLLLKKMSPALLSSIDVLEISHYPEMKETVEELRSFVKPLAKKYGFVYYIKDIGYFNEIDTVSISDKEAIEGYKKCTRISYGCSIFNGYYYKCMRPKTTNLYLEKVHGIKLEHDLRKTDGIEISEDNFAQRLDNYLNSTTMLESCKYCLMGLEQDNSFCQRFKSLAYKKGWIVKIYYKYSFLYNGYKKIKKQVEYDEGAHTKDSLYVKTQTHKVLGNKGLKNQSLTGNESFTS